MKQSTNAMAAEPLARELMESALLTLNMDTGLQEAVRTLEENKVSGAPVVDAAGKLVGVLSLKDLLQTQDSADGRLDEARHVYYLADQRDDETETWENREFSSVTSGEILVQELMTPEVLSVGPEATRQEVCELMVRERIHRVIVTRDERALGIISTWDIVKSLIPA